MLKSRSVLAHLSQRLNVNYCDRYPAFVRPSVVDELFLNTSPPEPLVQILKKVHMNDPHDTLYQSCINGSGQLSMRATRALSFSIYCQTLFRVLSAGVLCTLRVAG